MSFFNSIKSAFVTEVDTEKKVDTCNNKTVDTVVPKVSNEPIMSNSQNNNITSFANVKIEGIVDNVLLDTLCSVIENNEELKSNSPTYMDLKAAANDEVMKKSIPDEGTRFTCAFVSMKVNNTALTKEKIISSVDKCIELIENERNIGMKQLEDARKENVDDKETKINEKLQEMTKLQEEMAKISEEIGLLKSEVANNKNELAIKNANFNKTVDFLVDSINKDKEKLLNVLI